MRLNKIKFVAFLPLKGHSERVPNKNLKPFAGRPLYHRVAETLLSSNYIDKILIDTDSEKIKEDVRKSFGDKLTLVDRPKHLCGGSVSMNKITAYDMQQVPEYNHFILTHCTTPLLKKETLETAIKKYLENLEQFDSLFSVTELYVRLWDKDFKPINHDPQNLLRTQDLDPIYEENAAIYIFSRDSFNNNNQNRIGKNPQLFPMNKLEAVDIDYPEDFILAETLYKILNK